MTAKKSAPLSFKPDLLEAASRREAFYQGEMIDRPLTCVYAPRKGFENVSRYGLTYRDNVLEDPRIIIDKVLESAQSTFYGGEAIPSFYLTLGPDEIAFFCGAELCWGDSEANTNWSKPFVEDWEKSLPLKIDNSNLLWQRMLQLYKYASERMAGKMILSMIDLHSNMDLLAAVRGPQRLCLDLIDCPEAVDAAMKSARSIFPVVWNAIKEAGKMDESGYYQFLYSMEGAAILQCDFSIMISPDMFDRWVLPALEEEAAIVRHPLYHWDGIGALKHFDSLVSSRYLPVFSFVPGAGQGRHGNGDHIDFLDILRGIQDKGKAIHVWGTPEQIKYMHRELIPSKVMYVAYASNQDEGEELLEWMVKNT